LEKVGFTEKVVREQLFLNLLKRLWQKNSVIVVFLFILIACGIAAPRFLRPENLFAILRSTSIVGIIALGMTFVIIIGGIDLSSGSVLATSGAVLILLQYRVDAAGNPLIPLPIVILACCLVALSFGFVNGIIISKASLPPFIVTLAIGIMARSVTNFFASGKTVIGNRVPEFTRIGNGSLFGHIPIPFIIVIIITIGLNVILKRSKFGSYIFAVGGNEKAARFSGIKIDRVKILTYMLAGLCTGIASTIEMSRMAAVAVLTSGLMYEFDAIIAVIIGGGSLSGGRGRLVGTLIGVILLGMVNNIIIMLSLSPYLTGAVKGAMILLAVSLQRRAE
jgi:ribose transport system permease protein